MTLVHTVHIDYMVWLSHRKPSSKNASISFAISGNTKKIWSLNIRAQKITGIKKINDLISFFSIYKTQF